MLPEMPIVSVGSVGLLTFPAMLSKHEHKGFQIVSSLLGVHAEQLERKCSQLKSTNRQHLPGPCVTRETTISGYGVA
jgi:hypothetical protein